jgi:hypothetical protein
MKTLLMTTLTINTVAFPLFQMEDETDDAFKFRIFTQADSWIRLVTEIDIPREGPVRTVWRNKMTIAEMTDDELSEEYFQTIDSDDLQSSSWWGVSCRTWRDLLKIELDRRRDAHN